MAQFLNLNKKITVNKVHIPINVTVGRRKKQCVKDISALSSEKGVVVQLLQGVIMNNGPSSNVGSHCCTQCGRNFSSSTNLYRHVRSIHKAETFYPKAKMKCCLCDYECMSRKIFDEHVTAAHGVLLLTEEFRFATFEDFKTWKASMEKDSQSSYIKKSGIRKTKTYEQLNYYCHRSGSFRPSRAERKRKLKAQGSCKINSTCPSRMMVTMNSEGVRVIFHKTHVGHECDLGHLRLSYEQRKTIADKLADNVPFEDILNGFRSSEPGRAQLLTRRDLLNIRREFGVSAEEVVNDAVNDDPEDENVWVKVPDEMPQEYPPVIFYITQESSSQELQLDEAEVRTDEPCTDICSSDTIDEAKNKLRVKAESLIGGCATVEDCQALQRLFVDNAIGFQEERQRFEKTDVDADNPLNVLA